MKVIDIINAWAKQTKNVIKEVKRDRNGSYIAKGDRAWLVISPDKTHAYGVFNFGQGKVFNCERYADK